MSAAALERAPDAMPAIPDDLRADLPALIEHERGRLAPAPLEQINNELRRQLSLIGGPMNELEKEEWIAFMHLELHEVPGDLALAALAEARRTCRRASEVLPAIMAYLGDMPLRRRRAVERIENLARVAGLLPA